MQQQTVQMKYVVSTQPGVQVVQQMPVSIGKEQKRDWNSSICGCANDFSSCCCTMFFPYCYLSCWLSERMGESCCTPLIVPDTLMMYRLKLRTKYNIEGSVINDCCCSYWCTSCAICQLSRELKYIKEQQNAPAFQ